jgi:hypothetical protein
VADVKSQLNNHKAHLAKIDFELATLKTKCCRRESALLCPLRPGGKAPGGRSGSGNPYAQPLERSGKALRTDVPVGRQKVIIVGGYPAHTEATDIEAHLRSITARSAGIADVSSAGKLADKGRILFSDSSSMWAFLKAHKGRQFEYAGATLWRDGGDHDE